MLAYLNLEKYINYDLARPPGKDNPGGGVATKTQRVLQAASQWMIVGTHKFSEADKYHIALVEPLIFSHSNDMSVGDKVKEYEELDCLKILYATEMAFVRLAKPLRDRIVKASDYITCVNHYHRDIFHKMGVRVDSILCDPIPESVFIPGDTKERVIIAENRIDWKKNTQTLIAAYECFKEETDFKLEYIGTPDMWGHEDVPQREVEIMHQLQDLCDVYHGSIKQSEVASAFGKAAVLFHCAYHEVYSEGTWEANMCGCVPFALGYHPLFNRITENRFRDIVNLTETLNSMEADDFEMESLRVQELAMKTCSYAAFQNQLSDIFKKLGGK